MQVATEIQVLPKIQTLIKSPKRYKVAYGGRGSGKSYGIAQVLAHRAVKERCRILCTRAIQNTLKDSALSILKRVIEDSEIDMYFDQSIEGLRCKNGSEFIFRGLQHPERIKSLDDIKYCWVEEAHAIPQLAWDYLIPTIRADDSELWITFNPDQETDPVYQMFVIRSREDAEVVEINYSDNEFFPTVLLQELEYDKRVDYEKYLHIWEGNCRTISDAQVFRKKYRVAAFETPENVDSFYYGADWGFSQDPTTLIRCFIRNDILWIDYEAYGVGVDIDDTPTMFKRVPGADKWPITADSARPETISYMQKRGFKIRGANKGKGSVEDGIAFIRSFKGVVIHKRCKHTADEFKLYSYEEDTRTGEIKPTLKDKNNHCIDALRYALEKMMQIHGTAFNITLEKLQS
jgi:phage terminase large subunit